jgi:formyl-CoA transferase
MQRLLSHSAKAGIFSLVFVASEPAVRMPACAVTVSATPARTRRPHQRTDRTRLNMDTVNSIPPAALRGVRVIEMGQLIAGPFAGKTLGEFGADVIKIEAPGAGDPLRNWRMIKEGTSVWWQVQSRNKRSIALDLRSVEGQDIARKLIAEADVLIENFRPGTLEGWGMGWDALSKLNPGLVMLRISGYGQTGPYRDLPGFGAIGEAMGGLRHLTGEPGQVPVRCGISIGDTLAALHGTIGILTALYHRKVNGGQGQVIDVALNEAVLNVMESLVPEYSAFGAVREAAGSALPGIAPSNAYRCIDGYVLIAGNGDSIFKRLMQVIQRDDLAADPELTNNAGRVARVAELDAAIGVWTATRPVSDVLDLLGQARVPAGKVYTARDIAEDPHYRARDMILSQTTRDGYALEVPGIVPKLLGTPGSVRSSAPGLGDDTDAVLQELGLSMQEISALRLRKVVA